MAHLVLNEKYIERTRSCNLVCSNKYLCAKNNCSYTIATVIGIDIEKPDHKQALLGCSEELGSLVMRVGNTYLVRL